MMPNAVSTRAKYQILLITFFGVVARQ
jgi:hypothetical protein